VITGIRAGVRAELQRLRRALDELDEEPSDEPLPTSGPLAGAANIARVAREVEQLGYDSVWTYERLLRPTAPVAYGGGEPQPLPEMYG